MEHKKSNSMQSSQLMKLFEDQLKDIYWAEKALVKAMPKMIENATSGCRTKEPPGGN
jgi:ferritin-like metal-binding protein YciE